LPLTQQIVVAHGGCIACKARHPHGTTFEVWLPAAAQTTTGPSVRRVG
jgi:signal transduction histidine kinase